MKRVGQALLSPWFLYPLGAVLLSLLVWFLPEIVTIDFLQSVLVRLGIIAFIVLVFGLLLFLHWRKGRKADKDLVAGIAEVDPTGEAISAENKQIEEKLKTALADVRQTLGKGGQALYQLPWYAIIGPPGAGKTTALLNSGLRFPLAERHGAQALKGVGGTRNCDWWFTEGAVILDTAGRWTTQDSDSKVDQAAWGNFLGVLKRTRERQPLNGILVVFGVSDLLGKSREERIADARAVRTRLLELQVAFGLTLPIYVVLTKLDLIAGFVEFFDDLDREGREQVLGLSFPLGSGNKDDLPQNRFSALFDRLIERQRSRLLDRLQSERDLGRRTLIYGFPSQFASVGRVIDELLAETFNDSRFANRLSLRGVYFTSATQQGSPIDRLMEAISGKFGIQRQVLPPQVGQGRGFFLRRLFDDLVFNEAGLVGTNPKVERRIKIIRYSAFAATAVVLLTLAGLWTWSYVENNALVSQVRDQVQKVEERITLADKDRFNPRDPRDADPRRHMALLNDLRRLPTGYDHQVPRQVYLAPRFGLGQDESLGAQTRDLYHRGLVALLLPRLLLYAQNRLADGLKENPTGPEAEKNREELFEALRTYLLLGDPRALRSVHYVTVVDDWFKTEFEKQNYAASELVSMQGHVKALAAYGVWDKVALDERLVKEVQDRIASLTVAARALKMLERSALVNRPAWHVIDAVVVGREDLDKVLVRRSGKSMTDDAVPFLYTRRGYYEIFLPTVGAVTGAANTDAWVTGQPRLEGQEAIRQELDRTMRTYFDRYAGHWKALLQDLRLQMKDAGSPQGVADLLARLGSGASPLRAVYTEIARQTMLTHAETIPASAQLATGRYIVSLRNAIRDVEIWFAISKDLTGAQGLGTQVEREFLTLRRVTGVNPTQLDPPSSGLAELLNRLGLVGQKILQSSSGENMAKLGDEVLSEAKKPEFPPDLREMLTVLGNAIKRGGVDLTRDQMEAMWSQIFQFCSAQIANKYPVNLNSRTDIPTDRFTEMFGKGQRVDKFIQVVDAHLDKGTQPWRWKPASQATYLLPPALPPMLQRAAEIGDSFFAQGGGPLDVKFTLTPVDGMQKGCSLEIGGDQMSLEPDARPKNFSWPSGAGKDARVTCASRDDSYPGQWGFFRLLNAMSPSGRATEWKLSLPGAGLSMRADFLGSKNPLTARDSLRQFQCVPFTQTQ